MNLRNEVNQLAEKLERSKGVGLTDVLCEAMTLALREHDARKYPGNHGYPTITDWLLAELSDEPEWVRLDSLKMGTVFERYEREGKVSSGARYKTFAVLSSGIHATDVLTFSCHIFPFDTKVRKA